MFLVYLPWLLKMKPQRLRILADPEGPCLGLAPDLPAEFFSASPPRVLSFSHGSRLPSRALSVPRPLANGGHYRSAASRRAGQYGSSGAGRDRGVFDHRLRMSGFGLNHRDLSGLDRPRVGLRPLARPPHHLAQSVVDHSYRPVHFFSRPPIRDCGCTM